MVFYNFLSKISNRSAEFSGLEIIEYNVVSFRFEITHVRSTFLCDAEIIYWCYKKMIVF